MYVDWFIDHILNPDYDYVVESLKGTLGVSLYSCYMKVLCKAADVARLKPKDQNTLTPREMRITLPQTSSAPSLSASAPSPSPEKLDLLKYKKDNGIIYIPQYIFGTLSKNSRKELI